jgi:hypothetical protein
MKALCGFLVGWLKERDVEVVQVAAAGDMAAAQ